jgi:ankyrin repeat protein
MSELIAHGADMHAVSSKYTILDLAAMNGKWMLAEKLIGLGATFSSNFAKRTTLHSSSSTLDTTDLPYLHSLLTQSSVRANSRQRWPLLHTVAKSGNIEVAKRILDAKGADIDSMDRHMVRLLSPVVAG